MKKIYAKPISYAPGVRDYDSVKFIVIHYTGNRGDTAENNAKYFQNHNKVEAGAHFFVDRKGSIVLSIPMNRTAYAVGGKKYNSCWQTGGGLYYGVCSNSNSVSIELCDILNCYPSAAQIRAVKRLIKHIRKYCKNAKDVIRHFDVNGKACPASMCIGYDLYWERFLREIL